MFINNWIQEKEQIFGKTDLWQVVRNIIKTFE